MKEKLHVIQVAVIVYMIQSGVILFGLPRIVAEAFGTNGWIGLVPVSIIGLVNIFLIIAILKKGNGKSVFSILEESIPKWICYPFYILLVINFSVIAVLISKNYILLIRGTIFPEVSANSFMIYFLIAAIFFASKGIYNMGKITFVFFLFTIWTIFLLLILLPEFSFQRMMPFFFQGEISPIEKGFEVYTAFVGFELVMFLFPYIQDKKKFGKAVIIGHLFTTFIYLAVCFVSMGFYSFEQLKNLLYPTQNLLKFMETPLIERIENLVFVIFFLKIIVTVTFYYWAAVETAKQINSKWKEKWILIGIVIASFIFSTFVDIQREINEILNIIVVVQVIFSFSFPLLLLILLWMKNVKTKRGNKIA